MLTALLFLSVSIAATAVPLCMWAGGCKVSTDCVSGAICQAKDQYYQQCVPDLTCNANGISCGSSGPSGCCSGVCSAAGKCIAASPVPQCTYTKPLKCWKQAYPTNTVFLNTLSGPNGHDAHVQMGYISFVDETFYPLERFNGSPVLTPQYAKDLVLS